MEPSRVNKKAILFTGVALAGAVALFAYLLLMPKQVPEEKHADDEVMEPAETAVRIMGRHVFKGGMHTVVGSFDLPTPCHTLQVSAQTIEEDARNIELQFSTFLIEGEQCAQVITPHPYRISFEAPEDVILSASVNGEPAILNLVPVPDGEDIENFDEYIKG